ncbi:MAG: Fic family protein [Myxococcaceae bacterium]
MQLLLQRLYQRLAYEYAEIKRMPAETLVAMHRTARISSIGASTRIENAVLTDAEVNWIDTVLTADAKLTAFDTHRRLIENKLSKDRERSIEEVAGCREMLHLIYEQGAELYPLTETTIRGLHASLMRHFKQAGPYVGRYKGVFNSVIEHNKATGETRTVFETASPGPITEAAMRDCLHWYNERIKTRSFGFEVVCQFVLRFLAIHPFQDGNGRLGRGLFLLALLQSHEESLAGLAPYLGIDRQIERHRAEYYLVLNQCSQGRFSADPDLYNFEPFVRFMIKMLNLALDGIQMSLEHFKKVRNLSESATKVLDCFKEHPEIRLTMSLILQETKLARRTTGHALLQLVSLGLIQKYGQGAGVRYQLVF